MLYSFGAGKPVNKQKWYQISSLQRNTKDKSEGSNEVKEDNAASKWTLKINYFSKKHKNEEPKQGKRKQRPNPIVSQSSQ